jgi:hypothetical protein
MELHNTGYGQKLLKSDIPGIRKALERIADVLEEKERKEEVIRKEGYKKILKEKKKKKL